MLSNIAMFWFSPASETNLKQGRQTPVLLQRCWRKEESPLQDKNWTTARACLYNTTTHVLTLHQVTEVPT
ncbi:hypothetical protein FHG87_000403 [Trinorchestia longiramus]|nr:hypothetical protein FHG87_000403 [Trinorchestia longiramus]